MAFDTKNWLMTEMGFTAEQAETLAPQFADKAPKLEAVHQRQTALAAREQEIASTQEQLRVANERLNAEMAEWAALSAREKEASAAQFQDLEAARMRATQLETRLTALATQNGIDPKTLIDGTVPLPVKKEEPVAAPIDTSKFLTRDAVAPVMDFQLELPATLQYIAEEHRALFGDRLDTREIVKEIKARAAKNDGNIDPVRIWEEKFGVSAKRDEVAKAKYDSDIAAAEARGREAAMTERAMPGPADPGRHAPIFRNGSGQFAARTSRLNRPQPETSVRSAAAALATGKYRTPDTGARG